MTEDRPRVAVIVLTFNKREDLLACLESLNDLDYAPYETLVVDNGSEDGSAEAVAAAFPDVHLLQNGTNLGAPLGRNRGRPMCRSTYRRITCCFWTMTPSSIRRSSII